MRPVVAARGRLGYALPLWLLEEVFERQGLSERLDAIVLSPEVGKRKPDPAIFERALADIAVSPAGALCVGDRLYQDIRWAKELGDANRAGELVSCR